jgi:hypothetical protein
MTVFAQVGQRGYFHFKHRMFGTRNQNESGIIINREIRYGKNGTFYGGEGVPTNPLVTYINDITGEINFSDESYLVKCEPVKNQPIGPYLIKNSVTNSHEHYILNNAYCETSKSSVLMGPAVELFYWGVSRISYPHHPGSFDHSKIVSLIKNSKLFRKVTNDMFHDYFFQINKKVLLRFVQQNINRVKMTAKEQEKRMTESNYRDEEMYAEDLDLLDDMMFND